MINLSIVGLLGVIAVSFLVMPRYNYGILVSRIADLETRSSVLQNGFEKINLLAGPDEEKRGAVLVQLDYVVRTLKGFDVDLKSFMDSLAHQASATEDLSRKVKAVEDLIQPGAASPHAVALPTAATYRYPSLPLETPWRLLPPPRQMAELGLEEFLEIVKLSLHDGSRAKGPAKVVGLDTLRDPIHSLFRTFQACMSVIDRNEQILVQELVESKTRLGQYEDEDPSRDPNKNSLVALREGGTIFVKNLEDGRRRVFRITTDEHPEMKRFDGLRESVKDSLLTSLSAITR